MKLFTRLVVASALMASPVLADTVAIGTPETYDPGSYTIDSTALHGFKQSPSKIKEGAVLELSATFQIDLIVAIAPSSADPVSSCKEAVINLRAHSAASSRLATRLIPLITSPYFD